MCIGRNCNPANPWGLCSLGPSPVTLWPSWSITEDSVCVCVCVFLSVYFFSKGAYWRRTCSVLFDVQLTRILTLRN